MFTIKNINLALGTSMTISHIALPIGNSFFSFQTISYVIDVYRKNDNVQTTILLMKNEDFFHFCILNSNSSFLIFHCLRFRPHVINRPDHVKRLLWQIIAFPIDHLRKGTDRVF